MKTAAQTKTKFERLKSILKKKVSLLIVLQDNPDPDSIAAAAGLKKIANTVSNVACTIVFSGTVGRGENRALVRYLGVKLRKADEVDFNKFDLTAIVDAQPYTGNNSFPEDRVPDIVIDHHAIRNETRKAAFTDVRSKYGATATILYEYLVAAEIVPEVPLATALLYAIRSDTQDLGRKTTKADVEAVGSLFGIANKRALADIQRGRVQRDYFEMLSGALQNARVYNNSIITYLGDIENPDMISEVADLLLRDDDTYWTLCYGFSQEKLLLSIRTSAEGGRADKVIRHIIAHRGTGGGHYSYAGGQIPLRKGTKVERNRLEEVVRNRFLESVFGHDIKEYTKLVGSKSK